MRHTIKGFAAVLSGVFLFLGTGTSDTLAVTTVKANFDGVSPSKSFNYTLNGSSSSTTAGIFNWTSVAGGTMSLGSFDAFCIELGQNTHSPTLFEVKPLSNGPYPGIGTGGPGINGAMGAAKASLLSELWGRYFASLYIGTSTQQQDKAAAFQIAVWEIVFDSGTSLALGDFRANSPGGTVESIAQGWLNSLNGTGPMELNLVALTNSTYQDMVTVVQPPTPAVPEAATIVLGALGLGAIGLRLTSRRRTADEDAAANLPINS